MDTNLTESDHVVDDQIIDSQFFKSTVRCHLLRTKMKKKIIDEEESFKQIVKSYQQQEMIRKELMKS